MTKQNKLAVTGLWEKELPNGEKYFSAKLGSIYYSVMKNNFKRKDTDPDYILYMSQNSKITDRSQDENDSTGSI